VGGAHRNEPACKALIDHKADVRSDSVYGTAVEAGVLGGNPKVIRLLLDNGAALTKERVDKIGAVMAASDQGHVEILRMLLALKPDVNTVDEAGMTALMHAARRGQIACAKLHCRERREGSVRRHVGPNRPALRRAERPRGRRVIPDFSGAKVDALDKAGNTPLLLAARYCGDGATVTALTKAGANPGAKDAKGALPRISPHPAGTLPARRCLAKARRPQIPKRRPFRSGQGKRACQPAPD
jgi:ankyrin repeat protein